MKTKHLRFFVIIISILIFLISTSSNVIAKIAQTSRGSTQSFGITLIHSSPYLNGNGTLLFGYMVGAREAYRIYSGSNDYENTIICLNKDGNFPGEAAATGNYKSLGSATVATLKEAYSGIDDTKANKIMWLMRNAVLPEDSETVRDIKLQKIFDDFITRYSGTEPPVTLETIKRDLTEDDLVFAYQCAVWEYTNSLDQTFQGKTSLESNWNALNENKKDYINEIINYYRSAAGGDELIYNSSSNKVNPKITKTTSTTYQTSGNKIFAGPFKIETSQTGKDTIDYTVKFSFKDENGNQIGNTGYLLTTTASTNTTPLQATKASLEGKEFYFAFPTGTEVRTIDIELDGGTKSETVGTAWVATSGENNQPLLSIDKREETPIKISTSYTFGEPLYDVALRKYIVSVYRKDNNNVWKPVYNNGELNTRIPAPEDAEANSFNQRNYKHEKEPVDVRVGDRVVYGINLYNEMDTTIRITQITDHLPPSGLKFITSSSELADSEAVNGLCSPAGRNIIYSADTNRQYLCELGPHGAADTIKIEFEVTADASGKVVTNIAEITEMADTSGKKLTKDIDSLSYATLPTTEEGWQNYTGDNNKTELDDSTYYYKGQEDDDDFEKIRVPGNIDLALRKSITTVNGEQKNRAKAPDTAPLKDGDINTTTSNFSDIKTPAQVKTGDVVIYTIRVFNEGDTDAYASKVTDYIPEGLGFIVNHDINYINGWTFPSSTNMVKISAIENATSNLSASDFSKCGQVTSQDDVKNIDVIPGNVAVTTGKLDVDSEKLLAFNQTTNTLDIHEIQVACVVLAGSEEATLRNIAAITEYKDEEKNVIDEDIDSVPDNDLSNFNESNHQDDEDYEKLVLKQTVYDLALKKYVSEVKDATGNTKTIVDGQKRNLQITSVDALERRTSIADKADATYSFGLDKSTTPVQVEQGDSVVYTIRVYNEGLTDATVENLVDEADQQLSFIPAENSSINQKYGWTKFTNIGDGTGPWESGVESRYLENKVIPAFDSNKKDQEPSFNETTGLGIDHGVSYVEVKIEFKVTTNKSRVLRNIAEIHSDDGDDNDSIPRNKSGREDDEDFDVVIPQTYDLALKKYVSSVLDATNNSKRIPDNQKRTLRITDVAALENRSTVDNGANAIYSFGLDKENTPVVVERNDSVIYTIRVYNEGLTDAKVGEIVDAMPEELTFLNNSTINQKYGWRTLTDVSGNTGWTSGIVTEYFKDTIIPAFDSNKKNQTSFNEETGLGIDYGVSYVELKVEFRVNTAEAKILRNIAEITKDDGDDDDSIPNNMNPTEDDEDFDVIIPVTYDLALKKFVSGVSDATNKTKRIPDDTKRNLRITSVTELENRGATSEHADATYSFGTDKEEKPVRVQEGDNVVYTIRVYNEGKVDAKVEEIKDIFPEGLSFLPDSTINKKYNWKPERVGDDGYLISDYHKGTTIPAFDSSKKNQTSFDEETGLGIDMGVSYVEFKIEFKVATSEGKTLENIAEITKDDGDDDDSKPNNNDPEDDDQDNDFIIPTKFDLALRKFITQIDDKEVDDRIPEVDTAELEDRKSTTADYEHTKEPKIVVKGQTVIYTIRVYNEGTIDGYVAEIKDDIPEGLKFLPNHKINKDYMWKMYDSEGNETENIYKATTIRSDYGAQENGTRRNVATQAYPESKRTNSNLLLAFEPDYMDTPDYIDIKVAFEVSQESVTDGNTTIINTAEITKNTDDDGNIIDDVDSTPDDDKGEESGQDDRDKEYLELKYFDLSLLKYISKVIVTENGVTKETNTGYNGKENPEPVVKVEINKKNLANTQVKYVYSIKVTNEGQIEGYAKEVKDRIPTGLAFYEEDNKECNWKIGEFGVVTTDYLANKLLQPGDSEIITLVLRWENSESNLGQKVNTAEISKDENPYGVPDLDSKPDNNKDGEDDQDEAIAVISLTTGSAPMYIALITMIIAILGAGFYLIYKYVVKK